MLRQMLFISDSDSQSFFNAVVSTCLLYFAALHTSMCDNNDNCAPIEAVCLNGVCECETSKTYHTDNHTCTYTLIMFNCFVKLTTMFYFHDFYTLSI